MNNVNVVSSIPKRVKKHILIIEEDHKESFLQKFSRKRRINMLYKIIYWKQIDNTIKKCNIRKGANLYAFEYLKLNLNKYVRIKDVQEYCNMRTKEVTGHPLGDPPRAFEILRKDKLPLEWSEIKYRKNKYVKYTPHIKEKVCIQIIDNNKHKNDSFSKSIIQEKIKLSNYKCCITGIPQDNGDLAADHFIPKEKGGLSDYNNCIIINKILNEKKNKKLPIEWFCETLLRNFLNICKNVGILEECKNKMINYIKDF
jgi:5-methylcytosine-specific restriction endonuclease McrA